MDTRLARLFRQLTPASYGQESPASKLYNCIAYAAGFTRGWWQPPCISPPDPELEYFWPEGAPDEPSLYAYIKAFETQRYVECQDGTLELGFEKIAIYVHQSELREYHAARQLPTGWWASKFGKYKDLEHATAEILESEGNYKLEKWMKRPRSDEQQTT